MISARPVPAFQSSEIPVTPRTTAVILQLRVQTVAPVSSRQAGDHWVRNRRSGLLSSSFRVEESLGGLPRSYEHGGRKTPIGISESLGRTCGMS